MSNLKKLLCVAVATTGLFVAAQSARAEDAKAHTGTLIDNMCGEKKTDEKSAEKHTVACAKKEACAASGYSLIVGDKHFKLDEAGNEKAKEYLATENPSLKVTIEGKAAEGKLTDVASIKAAEKKEG